MQMVNVTYDSMPSAIGLILDRLDKMDGLISGIAAIKKDDNILTTGKRITDAAGLSKYLKCPIATIYGKQHRGQLPGKKMPGSRKLYFDLDEIDSLITNN